MTGGVLAGVLTAATGCLTEVAPSTPEPVAQASGETAPPPAESLPETAVPAAEETAPASAPPPSGVPWSRNDQDAPPPESAGDLFGSVASTPSAPVASPPASEEETPSPGEPVDEMAAFFAQTYGAELVEKTRPTADSEAEADAEPEPPAEPEPVAVAEAPETAVPETVKIDPADLEDLWGPPAAKSVAAPVTAPADLLAGVEAPAELPPLDPITPAATDPLPVDPVPTQPAVAKAPTTTEPADSASIDDLWADLPPAEPSEPVAPAAAPKPTEPEPAPAEPPVTAIAEAPAPEPLPTPLAKPPAAPDPAPSLPAVEPAPRVASRAPLAAEAVEPLPSVPVLSYNTRHLAWLLGGKLGLAGLADLDGATPSEVASWSKESSRLARELGVGLGDAAPTDDDPVTRVQGLISRAGGVAGSVGRRHGDDHAALLEIAVKTNALLVLATERPDLSPSVGRAVRNAAERALLPEFLWEDAVRNLREDATAEEIHQTIVKLHKSVESFLR